MEGIVGVVGSRVWQLSYLLLRRYRDEEFSRKDKGHFVTQVV